MTEGLRLAVAALDKEYGPLWDEQINLTKLHMMWTDECILGQLNKNNPEYAGHWRDTVERLVGWDIKTEGTPTTYFATRGEDWQDFILARRVARMAQL